MDGVPTARVAVGQVETLVIVKVRWTAPCDPQDRKVADLLACVTPTRAGRAGLDPETKVYARREA
jgi:hypothetical protein